MCTPIDGPRKRPQRPERVQARRRGKRVMCGGERRASFSRDVCGGVLWRACQSVCICAAKSTKRAMAFFIQKVYMPHTGTQSDTAGTLQTFDSLGLRGSVLRFNKMPIARRPVYQERARRTHGEEDHLPSMALKLRGSCASPLLVWLPEMPASSSI